MITNIGNFIADQLKQKNTMSIKEKTKPLFYKGHNGSPKSKAGDFGLKALPLKRKLKVEQFGQYKVVRIKKENIGIDTSFQRAIDVKRIERIRQEWDYETCDLPCLYVSKSDEGYHYQITDGQHRICACPDDEVLCRVVNTKSSVKRCLEANDPNTKSTWSVHDLFWAKKTWIERDDLQDDQHIMTIIDAYRNEGWTPSHPLKEKKYDIGSDIATVHSSIYNTTVKHLRSRNWEASEKRKAVGDVMNDVVTIMSEVFGEAISARKKNGAPVVKFGGVMWSALAHALTYDRKGLGLGFHYDINEVIEAMKSGIWGVKGKNPRKDLLDSIDAYNAAMHYYLQKGDKSVRNRRTNAMAKVIVDMVKLYQDR